MKVIRVPLSPAYHEALLVLLCADVSSNGMLQIFMDWLQQRAMGKQDTLRLNTGDREKGRNPDGVGSSREDQNGKVDGATGEAVDEGMDGFNDDDMPLTWAEVRLAFTI